ncbi:hypothetical protein BJV74DRAFT_796536 [Russula compacta]|nr:hypothetical protein BJV74DRAFT_796536 [Russula compacta]
MPHRTPRHHQGFLPPPSKPSNIFARTPTPRHQRSGGFPTSKASPLATPNRVILPDGSPMLLYTPEQIKNGEHRPQASSQASLSRPFMGPPSQSCITGSTETPTRRRPTVFPPNLRLRKTSSSRPATPSNAGSSMVRRARDPTCPTVQLLRVLNNCREVDMEREVAWTVRDDRLGGRTEQRDRSRMWDLLGTAVNNVWPNIWGWIMSHTPFDNDMEWFTWDNGINSTNEDYISDPGIAAKPSSFERMGFSMSDRAYDTACELIRVHAAKGTNFGYLVDGINSFFLIYACADCGIPLPEKISREFLWKHLDAIIGAKCWRGLGSRSQFAQASPSASVSQSEFSTEEDPENIVTRLLLGSYRSSCRGATARGPDQVPVVQLQIVIAGKRWMARGSMGTVWSSSVCLDERDVACFAVMDLLARLLPSYRGVILEIVTNDVPLLLGLFNPSMGGWGRYRRCVKITTSGSGASGLSSDNWASSPQPTGKRGPAFLRVTSTWSTRS